MKKSTLILGFLLAITITINAQAPQSFKYQAIARDIDGTILSNQNISLRISIVLGNATGDVMYAETHNVHTSPFGLITLEIGNGKVGSGDISSIDWSKGKYFVNIEIDVNGGTDFVSMGVSQLLSVPYALYAERSGTSTSSATGSKEANSWTEATGVTYLTNPNNLGVGTTTPGAKLHVIGTGVNAIYERSLNNIGAATNRFYKSRGISSSKTTVQTDDYLGSFQFWGYTSDNTYNYAAIIGSRVENVGSSDVAGNLVFLTTDNSYNYEERMRLTADGSLGIGTTSPAYKLHVDGDINISKSNNYKINGVDMVSSPWTKTGGNIYYDGGVGIGTNYANLRILEVHSVSQWENARFSSTNNGVKLELVSNHNDWGLATWYGNLYLEHSTDNFASQTEEYYFSTTGFTPYSNDTKYLGVASKRWKNTYSIDGNYSGRVGIGTTSPSHRLHVEDNDGTAIYGKVLATSGVNYAIHGITSSSSGFAAYFEGGKNYFEGNVGIGTTNPLSTLHIHNTSQTMNLYLSNRYSGSSSKYGINAYISQDGTGSRYGIYSNVNANSADASSSYGGFFSVNSNSGPGNTYGIYASASYGGTGTRWAGYFNSGKVYIANELCVGTNNCAAGYLVSIDGRVMCEGVRVEQSGSWPDYVFDNNYQLMSLEELEKNIRKNKHLPGLPSAKNIEDNGIMLGEMTQNLTQKVEELTLYLIELNNTNKKLNNTNKELIKRIEKLELEN